MNFRMNEAVIKCFERSTVERIEENSNHVSPDDNANKYTSIRPWRNEEQKVVKQKKRHYTRMVFLNITLEKEGEKKKKKLLQHGVFEFGHPSKY